MDDNNIHWINIDKTYYIIHWIMIHLADSVIAQCWRMTSVSLSRNLISPRTQGNGGECVTGHRRIFRYYHFSPCLCQSCQFQESWAIGICSCEIFLYRARKVLETFLESERWKEILSLACNWLWRGNLYLFWKQQSLKLFVKNFIDFLTLRNKISRII